MVPMQENISLLPFNSFKIEATARYFLPFKNVEELASVPSQFHRMQTLVLGGGSNILFTKDFDGLVLKNNICGMEKIREDREFVYLKAGAGENWHQLVLKAVENNWGGLENLSLIPGSVGASPIQNIGAYGVELQEVFHELTAFHLHERSNTTFSGKDCAFGYRDSVFKGKYKDEFLITTVTFKLRKDPVFSISYGAIRQELERMEVSALSVKAVSDAVINIRQSKLPDPAIIGNAGSFFKNPVVTGEKFKALQEQFPSIVGYPQQVDEFKLAAGWLIEQCGWKGVREGDAGCHPQQALVLVNYDKATGKELMSLAKKIITSVHHKFAVDLETEVNIL